MKTKQRILKAILHNGSMSRADLSDILGISPSRISEVTGLMIDEGLLFKAGYGSSNGRGRKNILLDIDTSRQFALGIGLCQGVLSAGITTVKGETIESKCIKLSCGTSFDNIKAASEAICKDIIKNCCLKPEQLLGIGICADKTTVIALGFAENTAKYADYPLPVLIEPADEYLEYSSAYIPINPAEMYMFGCAKIIRDIFLADN